MKLAKRLARYLNDTRAYKFRTKLVKDFKGKIQLEAYSDADFAAG
uniref:Uncharacterized protein n=1 Tax=Peronospora matthiolae TaxID=2874970 RepID=A0AAV1T433_9STRA